MDVAVVALTAALVMTTAVYAYFTWRMAQEMQTTRLQSIRPRLALYVRPYSQMGGNLALRSLGPGAALDVEVTITFKPEGETRQWRAPVFPPGEEAEFFFPGFREGGNAGFKELEKREAQADLHGSMRDVTGNSHTVDEHLDVAGWSKLTVLADQRYPRGRYEDVVASELKKIREALEKVRTVLDGWKN